MLKSMRKHTKLIIWIVSILFGLTLGGVSVSSILNKEGQIAGEVFGKKIFFQEYDRFYKAAQIFSFGNEDTDTPDTLRQNAWQSLILAREAKNQGIQVTDEEVRSEINRLLEAQGVMNVTPEIYKKWVQATVREEPAIFEKQLRELMLVQKTIRQFNEAPVEEPAGAEIEQRFKMEHFKMTASTVSFDKIEEAQEFQKQAAGSSWDHAARAKNAEPQTFGPDSLVNLARQKDLPINFLLDLTKHEPPYISEPFPIQDRFAVLQMSALEAPDPALLKENETKYRDEIVQQKKIIRFLTWSNQLMQRANLKDYLPKPES
ncbi:MAG: hypothetical protein A2Z83_03285 [Omnitrophica bacterium GWA2_52_8]|nr:MAG: hypothetical protein A2Z83_03285 [Omnitrophica bacterium GWA2_52_8]